MPFSKTIALPTGLLTLHIQESESLFQRYIDFAARNNPKRGFLFISKVLAKHYPCQPTVILESYTALVDLLKTVASGERYVFIGMAETATALGSGVYEHWFKERQQTGIYCQTTRYFLNDQPFLAFEEAHSHASDFYLYLPQSPEMREIFDSADTLVLIDDEISTGNTFANLIHAYQKINPHLKRVIVLSLLNLTDKKARETIYSKTGIHIDWFSLLTGHYHFSPALDFYFNPVNVNSHQTCKKAMLSLENGRLGTQGLSTLKTDELQKLSQQWQANSRILVLGTGEFIYPAVLIGFELEKLGFEVFVQSTTRSPILIGHAIQDCLKFTDNYGDNIPNFLYNSHTKNYDYVLVCHETPKNDEINKICLLLNAISIQVNNGTLYIS